MKRSRLISYLVLASIAILGACSAPSPSPSPGQEDVRSVSLRLGYGEGRVLYIEADQPEGEGPYSALRSSIDPMTAAASITFIENDAPVTDTGIPLAPYSVLPCALDLGDISPSGCPDPVTGCWTVGVLITSSAAPPGFARSPAILTDRDPSTGAWTGETYQGGPFSAIPQCSADIGPGGGYVVSPLGGG